MSNIVSAILGVIMFAFGLGLSFLMFFVTSLVFTPYWSDCFTKAYFETSVLTCAQTPAAYVPRVALLIGIMLVVELLILSVWLKTRKFVEVYGRR